MDSAHRMRYLMWQFKLYPEFLATSLVCMYSPAHGNETHEAQTPIREPHLNHTAVWILGLCQALGAEAERAQATGWGCAVYGARSWRQTGCSRRVVQWLGQGCNANENYRCFFGMVGRCAAT